MTKRWIIGIDEVGRGPLAGPLTVAAVGAIAISNFSARNVTLSVAGGQFPISKQIQKFKILKSIKNSKKLSPIKREEWNEKICEKFIYAIASVGPSVIDRIGISKAAQIAVARCIKKIASCSMFHASCCMIFLDGGLYAPRTYPNQETIIKGDERHPLIAAASIVAKVRRDAAMRRLHMLFPVYGFDRHKGYGTKVHQEAIARYGLSSVHRRSFCANILSW